MNYVTILKLIPTIKSVVQQVEEMLPEGNGKEKLQVVLNILSAVDNTIDQYTPVVMKIVAAIVSVLNGLGIFKHKAK